MPAWPLIQSPQIAHREQRNLRRRAVADMEVTGAGAAGDVKVRAVALVVSFHE